MNCLQKFQCKYSVSYGTALGLCNTYLGLYGIWKYTHMKKMGIASPVMEGSTVYFRLIAEQKSKMAVLWLK